MMSILVPDPQGERRTKSPEAFRTISEVATGLDVPQHVLRFWESRFGQVKPVKRAGGRRYYRPEDVDLLRGIRSLLYSDGFTIKGVQKLLREQGVRYVAEVGRGEIRHVRSAESDHSDYEDEDLPLLRGAGSKPAPAQLREEDGSRLEEPMRVKLEILLAELLQLKGRLRGE